MKRLKTRPAQRVWWGGGGAGGWAGGGECTAEGISSKLVVIFFKKIADEENVLQTVQDMSWDPQYGR